jgi:hypothetical protein
MTRLSWEDVVDRTYEEGLDRGVLYLADGSAVPWNGLTGVDEDASGDENTPLFVDGFKYFDYPTIGDYVATLRAITYPDEFMELEGSIALGGGLFVDGQTPKTFGLSYRTRIANPVAGTKYGYKIHILYNLTAEVDTKAHVTLGEENSPEEFTWTLSGVPENVVGYRPTAHAIVDSTRTHAEYLEYLENILYGTDTEDPQLPPLSELVANAEVWSLVIITDNGDGTWTATGPDANVRMTSAEEFELIDVNVSWINADKYTIVSQ